MLRNHRIALPNVHVSRLNYPLMLYILITLTAVSLLSACSSTKVSTEANPGLTQSLNSGTPASANTTSSSNVLFQDDFSDPSSGWYLKSTKKIVLEYLDGEFRVYVDNESDPYSYQTTFIELNHDNVRNEVDVRRVSGSDSASAYLICRQVDEDNFVYGEVDFQGEASIGTFINNSEEVLADEEGVPGLQEGSNRLRMDCIGKTISLYVNGTQVASADVNRLSGSMIGFAAGGSGDGETDFRFDNFVVYHDSTETTNP